MTAAPDDRAKAAELLGFGKLEMAERYAAGDLDRIAAALAAARADADARWMAAVEGLAEELQGTAEITGGKVNGYVYAARLRGLTPSSEEQQ